VRALPVVVRRVLDEHAAEVSFPEDQHPVGEFGADGQDEAFGVAVRPWTAGRELHDVDACIDQHGVERRGELSGPIADEEPELEATCSPISMTRLRAVG
jgi:hypothetical protein